MYEKLGASSSDGGVIVKYLGDALLCIFPMGSENEVVNCALKLRQAFAQIVSRRGLSVETDLEIALAQANRHRDIRAPIVAAVGRVGEEVNRAETIGHHRGIRSRSASMTGSSRTIHPPLPDFKVKWQTEPLKVWKWWNSNVN